MPRGDEFDVVIPVTVRDNTGPGAASAKSNVEKMVQEINTGMRRGTAGMRANATSEMLAATDMVKSKTQNIGQELVTLFDKNNFLIRQMARAIAGNAGYAAAGLAKLALSWQQITSSAEHAYTVMGKPVKGFDPANTIMLLEKATTKTLSSMERGVLKAEGNLSKAQKQLENANARFHIVTQNIDDRAERFVRDLARKFGVPINLQFLRDFKNIEGEMAKQDAVFQRFGRSLAQMGRDPRTGFNSFYNDIVKTSNQLDKLEVDSTRAFERASEAITTASVSVGDHQNRLSGLRKEYEDYQSTISNVVTRLPLLRGEYQATSKAIEEQAKKLQALYAAEVVAAKAAQGVPGLRGRQLQLDISRRQTPFGPSLSEIPDLKQFQRAISPALLINAERSSKKVEEELGNLKTKLRSVTDEAKAYGMTMEELAGPQLNAAAGAGQLALVMGTVGTAVAAVIAILAALAIGYGVATFAAYKLTSAAASNSEEVHKLALETGFSAQTLSTYRMAAQNAGVSTAVITRAISQFQLNVSQAKRGMGELGPVFTAAGVDMKNAIAHPEEEFIKLTERMNDTATSASKYAAIQQLTGRGGYEFAAAMAEVGSSFAEAQKRAEELGLLLTEKDIKAFHEFELATKGLHHAFTGLVLTAGRELAPTFTRLVNDFEFFLEKHQDLVRALGSGFAQSIENMESAFSGWGIALSWVVKHLGDILWFIQPVSAAMLYSDKISKDLGDAVRWVADGLGEFNLMMDLTVDGLLFMVNPLLAVIELFLDLGKAMDTRGTRLGRDMDMSGSANALMRTFGGLGGPRDLDLPNKQSRARKGEMSDLERLEKQYKKLRFEIDSLYDSTSREYELRFKVENLQRVKGDLEGILKLRHELGIDLTEPLPTVDKDATEDVQRQQIEGIQKATRELERAKNVRQEIIKISEEQLDAESKLLVLQKTVGMPVVDAETRFQLKYVASVRGRMDAEAELTSELRYQTKLREDMLADEAGRSKKAYETLRLDITRNLNELDDKIRENDILSKVLAGGELDIEATIKEREANRPKTEIGRLTEVVSSISANVQRIADKTVGQVAPPAQVNKSNVGGYYALTAEQQAQTARGEPVIVATDQQVYGGTPQAYAGSRLVPATTNPWAQSIIDDIGSAPEYGPDDTVTVDADARRKSTRDLYLEQFTKGAEESRSTATRKANEEILTSEARLHNQLIAWDLDLKLARSKSSLEREQQSRQTTLNIQLSEDELRRIEQEDVETITRMWGDAHAKRLSDQIALKQEIVELEDEIAHAGEDSADRGTRARLKAYRDIQEADQQAKESLIESQIKIADNQIYHADRANAKVLEFLANEVNVTDVVADARINLFQGVFDGISSGLDRALDKLGTMKRVVLELILAFAKLYASKFFQQFFGLGTQSNNQMGGPGGGALQGLLSLVSRASGGGGGSAPGSLNGTFGGNILTGGWGGGASPAGTIAPGIFGVPGLTTFGSGMFPLDALGIGGIGGGGPESITGSQQQQNIWTHLAEVAQGAATQSMGGGAVGGMGGMFSGLMSMAPLLGAGIGAQLGSGVGGRSALGQIVGGAGGLILGGVAGVTAQAISLAGWGAGLAAAIPMLAVMAPLAIGLLVGAHLLARNKERRLNETDRGQLNSDTYTRVIGVLNAARRGSYDSVEDAWADFSSIKTDYFARIANYDKKTKDIATRVWNNEFEPLYWPLIQQAVLDSMTREQNLKSMHPEFQIGGTSNKSQLIRVSPGEGYQFPDDRNVYEVPGQYRGFDSEYMYAPEGTRVYRRDEMVKSRPFLDGGVVGGTNAIGPKPTLSIDLTLIEEEDGTMKVDVKSEDFADAVVHIVRKKRKDGKFR